MIPAVYLRGLYSVLMPDRVSITYQPQTSLGVYDSATVDDAWWRPGGGTVEGGPSAGVYQRASRLWYFPKTELTGQPNLGDLIVSPVTDIDPIAATWTVLSVNDAGGLGAWELGCVSLQLQENLRSTLTFARPNAAVDSAYRPNPTYTNIATGVPARVQPEGGDGKEVFDRITLPSRYTAYLGQTLTLRAKDRAFDGTNYYTVVGFKMPSRIDELEEVALEVIL